MLGVLLGSIAGVAFLTIILALSNILLKDKFTSDIRHNFSITTRRKIAAGVGAAFLLLAAIISDTQSPFVGVGLIVVVGLLSIFASTTQMEKDAIAEMEEEIVWRYENESEEEEEEEEEQKKD